MSLPEPANARRTITKQARSFVVDPSTDAYAEFWDWYETETWEPETIAILGRYLSGETTYVDFGAWIGPTVLFSAGIAKRVLCVEPDPVARRELERNLNLNNELRSRVEVFSCAVGGRSGTATLSSRTEGGDSRSSLVRGGSTEFQVEIVAGDDFVRANELENAHTYFKIDVEGAEYELVPALLRGFGARRPPIYLSMHPNFLVDKASATALLVSGIRAFRLNWRLLWKLRNYRHHYVYVEGQSKPRDDRWRNIARLLIPVPVRAGFLKGAIQFTDEDW